MGITENMIFTFLITLFQPSKLIHYKRKCVVNLLCSNNRGERNLNERLMNSLKYSALQSHINQSTRCTEQLWRHSRWCHPAGKERDPHLALRTQPKCTSDSAAVHERKRDASLLKKPIPESQMQRTHQKPHQKTWRETLENKMKRS